MRKLRLAVQGRVAGVGRVGMTWGFLISHYQRAWTAQLPRTLETFSAGVSKGRTLSSLLPLGTVLTGGGGGQSLCDTRS